MLLLNSPAPPPSLSCPGLLYFFLPVSLVRERFNGADNWDLKQPEWITQLIIMYNAIISLSKQANWHNYTVATHTHTDTHTWGALQDIKTIAMELRANGTYNEALNSETHPLTHYWTLPLLVPPITGPSHNTKPSDPLLDPPTTKHTISLHSLSLLSLSLSNNYHTFCHVSLKEYRSYCWYFAPGG